MVHHYMSIVSANNLQSLTNKKEADIKRANKMGYVLFIQQPDMQGNRHYLCLVYRRETQIPYIEDPSQDITEVILLMKEGKP